MFLFFMLSWVDDYICYIISEIRPPMGAITSRQPGDGIPVRSWSSIRPAFREISPVSSQICWLNPMIFPFCSHKIPLDSHYHCIPIWVAKKNIELPATSRFSCDPVPSQNRRLQQLFRTKTILANVARGVGGFEAQRIGDFSDSNKNGQISIDTFCIDTNMAMCFFLSCLIRR